MPPGKILCTLQSIWQAEGHVARELIVYQTEMFDGVISAGLWAPDPWSPCTPSSETQCLQHFGSEDSGISPTPAVPTSLSSECARDFSHALQSWRLKPCSAVDVRRPGVECDVLLWNPALFSGKGRGSRCEQSWALMLLAHLTPQSNASGFPKATQ